MKIKQINIYNIEQFELEDLPSALRELAKTMQDFIEQEEIVTEVEEYGCFDFQQDGELFNVEIVPVGEDGEEEE